MRSMTDTPITTHLRVVESGANLVGTATTPHERKLVGRGVLSVVYVGHGSHQRAEYQLRVVLKGPIPTIHAKYHSIKTHMEEIDLQSPVGKVQDDRRRRSVPHIDTGKSSHLISFSHWYVLPGVGESICKGRR